MGRGKRMGPAGFMVFLLGHLYLTAEVWWEPLRQHSDRQLAQLQIYIYIYTYLKGLEVPF